MDEGETLYALSNSDGCNCGKCFGYVYEPGTAPGEYMLYVYRSHLDAEIAASNIGREMQANLMVKEISITNA